MCSNQGMKAKGFEVPLNIEAERTHDIHPLSYSFV